MKQALQKKSLKKRIRDLEKSLTRTPDEQQKLEKEQLLKKLQILKKLTIKNPQNWGQYKAVKFFGDFYTRTTQV